MPDRPLSSAVVTRLKERESRDSRCDAERAFVDMRYARGNLPSRLPRVRSIVPGVRGELWVEQYEPDPQARATWWILDRRGLVVATLATPEGFRIRSVLHDRVAGVHTDTDGLESIRVNSIVR